MTVAVPTIPGREDMLARALRSVGRQSRPADAVLVERDFWRTGAAATRNRILAKVTTDWVAWLDDDDELLPNHLAVLLEVAEDTNADLVYPRPRMATGTDPTAILVNGAYVSPWGRQFTVDSANHIRHHGSFIPITHLVRASLARHVGFPPGRTLPDGRYQGEDERYLIGLLDEKARFEHVNVRTWLWYGSHGGNTAGLSARAQTTTGR